MKFKRLAAVALSVAMLLTFSMSAFAVDTSQTQNQTQFKSIDQRIQDLQNLKVKQAKIDALKTELKIIRELHQKADTLRKQLHALYKDQLRPAMKKAREAKNYDSLVQALTGLKQVQADLATVKNLGEQNKTKWDGMRTLRQNKDFDGAMAALKNIETNVQSKIEAYNKAIADMNNVIAGLTAATTAAQQ